MILLDKNVVSEPLKPHGNPAVAAWFDAQVIDTLYLSTVSVAELRYGVEMMPKGKRKDTLRQRLEASVLPLFDSRILTFDLAATEAYAVLRARARAAGQGMATADSYIAAIAAAKGFTVATRDTRPFEAAGVAVINPWVLS